MTSKRQQSSTILHTTNSDTIPTDHSNHNDTHTTPVAYSDFIAPDRVCYLL